MVVLNKVDVRDSGSSGGGRGTPRASGARDRNGGNHRTSDKSVADVIACATTGYSMESLGRKLSNSQIMNPLPTSARHHHHQDHQLQTRLMSQNRSSGSGSATRFPPVMHSSHECGEEEDESLSVQTPLYESIDPSRLTRYAHLQLLQSLLVTRPCTLIPYVLLPLASGTTCTPTQTDVHLTNSHYADLNCPTLTSHSSSQSNGSRMTSSLGIEMMLPDGRTYRPESGVYPDDDNMTDTEYFRSSYERRFQQPDHHEAEDAGDSVPCPEDFERNVNISDCTSFLDTQRMDRDKIEESLSLVGFLFTLMSLIIFLLDTGSDAVLAYFLLVSDVQEESDQWFKGTTIILIASGLIVNFFSLKWYVTPEPAEQTLSSDKNTHTILTP